MSSNFLETSAGVLSRSAAMDLCLLESRELNCSQRSPSMTFCKYTKDYYLFQLFLFKKTVKSKSYVISINHETYRIYCFNSQGNLLIDRNKLSVIKTITSSKPSMRSIYHKHNANIVIETNSC